MVDSQRVARTLAVTRAQYRATAEARARVRAKLAARGEFGAERTDAVPIGGQPGLGVRVVGVAKSTVALLAAASFAAGFWLGGQRASEPVPRASEAVPHASEPAPSAAAASSPGAASAAQGRGPELERAPAPAPSVTAAPASRTPSASPSQALEREPTARRSAQAARAQSERASSFGEEIALLQRAERAIRAGEPELALTFLADLDRHHPVTRFVEERTAARLMARCARGDAGANGEAEQFLRERRTSVYSDRLRALCGLEPEAASRDGNGRAGHQAEQRR